MARFLSIEWIDALDAAASAINLEALPALCIEHHVDGFVYHVAYEDGCVHFRVGEAQEPTVRFTTDRVTAASIARGELSAQRAFMNGFLRVDGDTLRLANAQPSLRQLPDFFADMRSTTEW